MLRSIGRQWRCSAAFQCATFQTAPSGGGRVSSSGVPAQRQQQQQPQKQQQAQVQQQQHEQLHQVSI